MAAVLQVLELTGSHENEGRSNSFIKVSKVSNEIGAVSLNTIYRHSLPALCYQYPETRLVCKVNILGMIQY